MSSDEFDDGFGSEDEAALLEVATQVERQPSSSMIFASSAGTLHSQQAPNGNGRNGQLNLYGERTQEDEATQSRAQVARNHQLVADARQEKPTHHELDPEAIQTWIYPTNLPKRSYQYNIVSQALRSNLLVALPTGP